MTDKRKVTTDALETLGTIITGGGRDAIHLAVEPVIAGVAGLKPGMDIGIGDDDGLAYGSGVKKVGIVDPFIKGEIKKGEMFWLIVYPRQITSLRHVWSHPDFKEPEDQVNYTEEDRVYAEGWLRDYCDNNDGAPQYQTIIEAYESGGADGEYFYIGGEDAYGTITDEFWDHMEMLFGKKIKHRAGYFACSC